ncbi:PDZ and LIM domain protein 1 [Argonauta hians]
MAATVINLQRNAGESWGFRLQGGLDFRQQLSVKKVVPNSPAQGRLHGGDAILAIGSTNTQNLTHQQANQLIKNAGNMLQLTLIKQAFAAPSSDIRPKGPLKFSPWKHQQQQ